MKTILVPTQNIPAMGSALETAVLLAQRIGAYIEGIPLWFGAPEFVVAELASGFSGELVPTLTCRIEVLRNPGNTRLDCEYFNEFRDGPHPEVD